MTPLLLKLALKAIDDEQTMPVFKDAVLESRWFHPDVIRLLRPGGTVDRRRVWTRYVTSKYPPRSQSFARAVAAVLLFRRWNRTKWRLAQQADSNTQRYRQFVLGFGPTSIPAGGTATVLAQPQVPFRGERLIVPSNIAGAIIVQNIRVGRAELLIDPMPGTAFGILPHAGMLGMARAQTSDVIALVITNLSREAVSFSAALMGTAG